jgi:hypothetical protein
MPSQVEICNIALALVGDSPITSLSDDSNRARILTDLYPVALASLLRSANWNFALARATLAAEVTVPGWGFSAAFPLPADCLRVVEVDLDSEEEWKIEGRKILANATVLRIRYISTLTGEGDFDPTFVDALASRLASDLAFALGRDESLMVRMTGVAAARLKVALGSDAIETATQAIDSDYLTRYR